MRKKKTPLRMCTGCGEMKPKQELVRVVKSPEGEISLDLTGKKPGRGAYVCKNIDCLKAARKARRFEKAFSCKIPDEIYDRMEEEMLGKE
ncbi:YlxR family protein [Thermocaproicibacter melissae]|nr:YlxR family protein [Thermocaproicibacter melissae]WBY65084.1 YlxR family protein [Thermocaproicibacter melissae]